MAQNVPLILLVDDDLDFLEMNRHVLEAAGYRVACARDPTGALREMAAARPALVITDLMMQALDAGFAFSRTIKEAPHWAGVPVILVTSASSRYGMDFHPKTPEELAAMHADAFLDEPVKPKVLLEKVEELLKRK
jgi:CheY-like chemotaxis protein